MSTDDQSIGEVAKAIAVHRLRRDTLQPLSTDLASIAIDTLRSLGWCGPGEVPQHMQLVEVESEDGGGLEYRDAKTGRLFRYAGADYYTDDDGNSWFGNLYRLVPDTKDADPT